jgi:hypothetical protein
MEYTIISAILSKGTKKIKAMIICKNEFAIATFSDKKLAKLLYKSECNMRGKDVRYDEDKNLFIEKFKGYSQEQVAQEIKKQMEKQGGTCSFEKNVRDK